MKSLVSLLLCLLLTSSTFAQTCNEYDKLIKQGKVLQSSKQYRQALNKFNAAKLCTPSKAVEVDKLITSVFDAIEKEKEEAVKQKELAEKAKIEAEKQTEISIRNAQNSEALYLTSESEKLTPSEALFLQDKAISMANDSRTKSIAKQKMVEMFNHSLKNEQFSQVYKYDGRFFKIYSRLWNGEFVENYHSPFSMSGNWLRLDDNKLLNLENFKTLDFGKDSSLVQALSNENLIAKKFPNYRYKIFDVGTKTQKKILGSDDFLYDCKFSYYYNYAIFENQSENLYLWNINKDSVMKFTNEKMNIDDFKVSNNDSIMVIHENLKLTIWNIKKFSKLESISLTENRDFKYYISGNGNWVLIIDNKKLKIWDVRNKHFLNLSKLLTDDFLPESTFVFFSEDDKYILGYNLIKNSLFKIPLEEGENIIELNIESIRIAFNLENLFTELKYKNNVTFSFTDINYKQIEKVMELITNNFYSLIRNKNLYKLSISTNGRFLILQENIGEIEIWDLIKKELYAFTNKKFPIKNILFSPDDKWVYLKDEDSKSYLFNLSDKIFLNLLDEEKDINTFLFSSNSKYFLTSHSKSLKRKLWKLSLFDSSTVLKSNNHVRLVNISPNKRYLVIQKGQNFEQFIYDIEKKHEIELPNKEGFGKFDFSGNSRWVFAKDRLEHFTVIYNIKENRGKYIVN